MTATEKALAIQVRDLREENARLRSELAKSRPEAKRVLPPSVREAGRRRLARQAAEAPPELVQAAADDICSDPVTTQRLIEAGDPLIPSDIRNALGGAL